VLHTSASFAACTWAPAFSPRATALNQSGYDDQSFCTPLDSDQYSVSEVLSCAVQENVGRLQKQWKMQGPTLARTLARQPQVRLSPQLSWAATQHWTALSPLSLIRVLIRDTNEQSL
jgi:hypothetical protein